MAFRVLKLRHDTLPFSGAAALACLVWASFRPAGLQASSSADLFQLKVRPLLEARCLACHNKSLALGELALDSAENLQKGGTSGPAVVAGNAEQSRLYRRVARLEEPSMPMQGEPLSEDETALLKKWIDSGAEWSEAVAESNSSSDADKAADAASSAEALLFREKVHPLLVRCQSCHDDALKYSGLSLETPEGLFYGGLKGPVVVPGDAEASRLYRKAARLEPHFMPLSAVMASDEEIAALKNWIEDGAVWADPKAEERARERAQHVARLKRFEDKEITAEERQWWAFEPVVRPPVPKIRNAARVRNPIDGFIAAKQEEQGLEPAPPADRETLMRRLYLDLTGLPPTPEQRARFLNDDSPEAYEKLVERLLDSRHYGERWGRHWLDVARYADSDGYEYDKLRPNAWRYRDYVIRAFNNDKPYDRFILEQLAGDELPDSDYDSIIALGFCRNGPFIGDMAFMQNEETRQDELDDIVSTTGSAFLGLTVGCARCHDHKYDPIRQKDYYRMVAIFAPSVRKDIPLAPPDRVRSYYEETRAIDRQVEGLKFQLYKLHEPTRNRLLEDKYDTLPEVVQIAIRTPPEERTEGQKRQAKEAQTSVGVAEAEVLKELSEEDRKKTEEMKTEIKRLEESRPKLPMAQAITDYGPKSRESYFLHRGSVHNKGSAVEPGTLAVLNPPGEGIEFPEAAPGGETTGRRLALAKWVASPDNPLTARVMVNRIWQHHFGEGLVATPNNFGKTGERPTHPELLDWLASEFVRRGWSVKAMHRLIVMSNVYRQASSFTRHTNTQIDPDNRLLWKMPLTRLEGGILRDSILTVSGGLNQEAGGPPVFPQVDAGIIESSAGGGDYQRWPGTKDGPDVWKRSVYIAETRTITPPVLDLFDPPDKVASCPKRSETTVPTQALQLMNNPFVTRQAKIFADRVRNEAGDDPAHQVERAFVLALGRQPSASELGESLAFLAAQHEYHESHNEELRAQAVDPAEIEPPPSASLIDLCHALFNINEFIYVN